MRDLKTECLNRQYVHFLFGKENLFTCGTMFLNDSMILELLASWKYEKQPVMMTTAVSTIPRYNCGRETKD